MMQSFVPTDPTPVKPRVEIPHKKLTSGSYLMSLDGIEVVVKVEVGGGSKTPLYRVWCGTYRPVSVVPHARFYLLPKELQ